MSSEPDDRRERQMEFIVTTLAQVAERQARFAADLEAEAAERRAREAEQAARIAEAETQRAHSDRRLDRLERIAKLFIGAGRRARRELRDQDWRLSALVEARMRDEQEARELRASIEQTNANVNQLADVVRRFVTGRDRNSDREG